jgi:hypothetical protein
MYDVRYSVFKAKDDTPIIICGTGPQCEKAMGMTYDSFRVVASRYRNKEHKSGRKPRKYRIVREVRR